MDRSDSHLAGASPETKAAVAALGGDRLLSALAELLGFREERIVDLFDARWDDLAAEEIFDWTLVDVVRLSDTTARVALDVALVTYPVNESAEEDHGGITTVRAYAGVTAGAELAVDLAELDFDF